LTLESRFRFKPTYAFQELVTTHHSWEAKPMDSLVRTHWTNQQCFFPNPSAKARMFWYISSIPACSSLENGLLQGSPPLHQYCSDHALHQGPQILHQL